VIHLYEERGDTFIHALNGGFALALWDSCQQKLIVANDRYGLCPIYHTQLGSTHLWASSPKAILAIPAFHRQINLAAMADFLCLGIPQGNDTIFEGIEEMPPASLVTCHGDRVRGLQYWDWSFQEEETGIAADDYLEELIFLLRQAAERRQSGKLKTGLLLSGGHDSRVVLSVLQRDALDAFTFGAPYCTEVRLAKRAAATSDVAHTAFEIRPDYLRDYASLGIARTEDLISCNLFHGISVYDQIASRTNALITGSAGEDIFGHFVRDPESEFWAHGFSVDRYYDSKKIMTGAQLEQLMKPTHARSMRGLARARFHRDFEKYESRHTTHVIDHWSVRQQQRRLYNRLTSLFPDNLVFRPLFLDNELIDFVQTIPPSMRWGQGSLYRQVLLQTAPQLARIPFTTTWGLPLNASHRQVARQKTLAKHWRHWRRKANRLSQGLIPPMRVTHSSVNYDDWLKHELRGWVESILLDAQTLERDYWNPAAIERLLRDQLHRQGGKLSHRLTALITFELWHRMYLDQSDVAPLSWRTTRPAPTGLVEVCLDQPTHPATL
jgi:asparagine synthetase B (glutamine-hydrolysing)